MIRPVSILGPIAILIGLLSCQSEEEIKRQRYITEGILVYKNNCANCHQPKGEGLANLYPPIAHSDYLADKKGVICLIRYGQQGSILVNGKPYNRPMPPQPQLSDLEVAELATYIYNEWGNETKLTDVKSVKPILDACKK
ncbi:c-type cytochrome [Spirosoma sp. HMF4905]|uniref:C-type cytochrome n=1 Tax=Spirosoma arboris TaxID=2682092 RepID=A0A7K1SFS5_9BACT|nr:cytochrome c [Spirosoma arboris]MVM32652.1 c-type cytochrome [Spirosoma arboris]